MENSLVGRPAAERITSLNTFHSNKYKSVLLSQTTGYSEFMPHDRPTDDLLSYPHSHLPTTFLWLEQFWRKYSSE